MCATNGRLSLLHDTLASQIEECAEVTGPICNWRAALGIAIPTCPSNSTYQGCTSSCPNTCNSPNAEDNCQSALIEGCECDYNHVWSGNRCVLESECGCYPQNIGF
uniref:TIL domain-containing protein n=1 Tax=Ciona savignyi TaxID=51511 RepID=H2ZC78_CIOSA